MLDVVDWGAGEPCLFVHGDMFGAVETWQEQRPLGDRHRLLLVNRRGFGESPDVDGEDFDVDAADVAELLSSRMHLVGHSYGGVVALLAAARRPSRVRSLALIEPPAFDLVRGNDQVEAFIAEFTALVQRHPSPGEFLPRFVRLVGGDAARLPQPLPPALERAARVQMRGRRPWEAEVALLDLAAARIPMLVFSGGHSPVFDAVCDAIESVTGARRAVIPGAGHAVQRAGGPFNDRLEELWRSSPR
ncbi:MAG: alpha/beta fold hydrolase [Gaiellales bacterium]